MCNVDADLGISSIVKGSLNPAPSRLLEPLPTYLFRVQFVAGQKF